ncbi:MAG: hypothetical protein Kow0077_17100 [Anaerolineae bacterium]
MVSPELLKRFPLFAGLDEDFIEQLAMVADEVALADGVWLFHEGDKADAFYVVLRGAVQLRVRLPQSRYADLDRLVEGHIVGWSAVCEPNFYTLSAFVPEGARLLRLDGPAVRELMQARPEMGFAMMCQFAQEIARRLSDLRTRFVSVIAT